MTKETNVAGGTSLAVKLCKIKRYSKKYPAAHLEYPTYGLQLFL
jgi:hypothetical protein